MEDTPVDNLYVAGLPPGTDESLVKQFFGSFGTVTSVKVLGPPGGGPPTTNVAAMVRFSTVEEATSVINQLNGTTPEGLSNPIMVKYAWTSKGKGGWNGGGDRPSPYGGEGEGKDGNGKGGGKDGKGGSYWVDDSNWGEPEISSNIYVQGLPAGTTEDSVKTTFGEFGEVRSIRVMPSKGANPTCAAVIRFNDETAAKTVKDILNGAQPDGFPGPLVVRFANQATNKGGGGITTYSKGEKGGGGWNSGGDGWNSGGGGGWNGGGGGGKGAGAGGAGKGGNIDVDSLCSMIYDSGVIPGGRKFESPDCSLYIAGLPGDCTTFHLYKIFSPFGAVHSTWVKNGGGDKGGWSIGFVNYLSPESAQAAIQAYNGMQLPTGGILKVQLKAAGGKM